MQSDTLESTDQRIDTDVARAREANRRSEARESARRNDSEATPGAGETVGKDPNRGRHVDTYA